MIVALTACSKRSQAESEGKLKVLATTTIVADVVKQVAGDLIDLEILLPVGTDPHTFTPTPQDLAKVSQAELLFLNGVGLESFLQTYLDNIGEDVRVVVVSEGVNIITEPDNSEHDLGDPHTWTDPNNVKVWIVNITAALSELDPAHSESYNANASAYLPQLDELDAWIETQVVQIPPENRKIISDHKTLAYFAQRYGFTQIGTVIPGTSTLAEPSAQDVALLEDLIRSENVHAIFVDTAANPQLTERISKDSDIKIILIYSGSLTNTDGDAGTYLDYMRYNVSAIVDALK
jgi:ABC-type Zn uptake system ZnuABC Zn-binding protein ZnuA